MNRGKIWTVSGSESYTGKTRPAIIVQDNDFDATGLIALCLFTAEAPLTGLPIEPNGPNGLDSPARVMVDKITTVRKQKIGKRLDELAEKDIVRPDRAVATFLDLPISQGIMH